MNAKMKELVKEVAEERKHHQACLSAQDGVDLKALIQEIIDKGIYKKDYETITSALLFEEVSYTSAIDAVQKIIDSGIFDKK